MPNSTTNTAQGVPNSNGINNTGGQQMPVNHQYTATAGMDMPQGYHQQQPGYASPSGGRQQQFSPHFQQGFGFDPDIDDMFNDAGIRSHFDRMRDPFGTFGSRKRSGNKNPLHSVSPSYYDDDDADFPQFGSLGRRRAGGGAGGIPAATDGIQRDDFFERLPPEFRQFIPDTFGMRRGGGGVSGSGATESPRIHTQQPQYYQTYVQPGTTPPQVGVPRSPSGLTRNVCDAAIQTEDPSGGRNQSEVDGHLNADNLNQHGLRNTVDMGVKTAPEDEGHNPRSHSAPPQQQEQMYPHEVPIQQQQQQPVYHSQGTGTQRNTPPPAQQQRQYPQNQQPPQFPKTYYPPQNQPHTQQQPTAPQTPGGSYIRTIPIFVEGRSEPLISQREIPQTEAQPTQAFAQAKAQAQAQQHAPQQQFHAQQAPHNQQSRPTPINTQQQPTAAQQQQQGPPPATPHTMDSINKIQDIQRDVLNLMTEVEKFGGQRRDKEYAYLDEMLTRNLLKLDTIDTQGKESIRLARKEAIKCIQASINVLEAKAEENAKTAQPQEAVIGNDNVAAASTEDTEPEPADATNIQEPIPLPPPESLKTNTNKSSENVPTTEATNESKSKEASPAKEISAETTTTTATVTKSGSGSSSKGESAADGKIE